MPRNNQTTPAAASSAGPAAGEMTPTRGENRTPPPPPTLHIIHAHMGTETKPKPSRTRSGGSPHLPRAAAKVLEGSTGAVAAAPLRLRHWCSRDRACAPCVCAELEDLFFPSSAPRISVWNRDWFSRETVGREASAKLRQSKRGFLSRCHVGPSEGWWRPSSCRPGLGNVVGPTRQPSAREARIGEEVWRGRRGRGTDCAV
jgi:hypothetical protein